MDRQRATTNREGPALVAVFIAFVPLAFSEEFLEATSEATRTHLSPWVLLGVDLALLLVIFRLAFWLQRSLFREPRRSLVAWWAVGSTLTLMVDAAVVWADERDLWFTHNVWVDFGTSLAYILSLAIIMAATVGASPRRVLTPKGRADDRAAWERFRPALPLLIGTLAAYIGSVLWTHLLDADAIRTLAHAADEARAEGLIGSDSGLTKGMEVAVIRSLCAGAVNQEYFAQLSQVIPLLLVALGVEARFFERLLKDPIQRAMTVFTVVILCVGEALAISALPKPNEGCDGLLSGWHEYVAFIVTLEACFVALATLVWALVVTSPGTQPKSKLARRPARLRGTARPKPSGRRPSS